MDDEDRLKIYLGMAETTRKWATVMDGKAAFLSAVTVGTLAFVWTGAKLVDEPGVVSFLAHLATVILLLALVLALNVVIPRVNLRHAFGKKLEYSKGQEAVSFFRYVADNYPEAKHKEYIKLVDGMDAKALAREALEQHYTVSHVVKTKADWVGYAGWAWLVGVILVGIALLMKA